MVFSIMVIMFLSASLVFERFPHVPAENAGKTQIATGCDLCFSRETGAALFQAMAGWQCLTCANMTTRRDRVCQRCRPSRRGRNNVARPRFRVVGKKRLRREMATYGPLPMARRLQQPDKAQQQELKAFRRALENEYIELLVYSNHSSAHSILAHVHCLLEGFAEKCKLPFCRTTQNVHMFQVQYHNVHVICWHDYIIFLMHSS